MRFVCRNCETFMSFRTVEAVAEGSLGITFECSECDAATSDDVDNTSQIDEGRADN